MTTPSVRPCSYPTCQDSDGNRCLTTQVMCGRCRRRYWRELHWLIEDYVRLRGFLPAPAQRGEKIRGNSKSFGHPAQWVSDEARAVAQMLNWIEDGLREEAGMEPPPHQFNNETALVKHAFQTLTGNFELLCTYSMSEDTATEVHDKHQGLRRAFGMTRDVQRLTVPCPRCDIAGLVRLTGHIECGACGHQIPEDNYAWFARVLLDSLIDEYDTPERTVLA